MGEAYTQVGGRAIGRTRGAGSAKEARDALVHAVVHWVCGATSERKILAREEGLVRFGVFLGLAILLAVVWVVSFLVFHVVGFLIHLLLVVAVLFLILQLVSGGKR
jgi:hypothetical protein